MTHTGMIHAVEVGGKTERLKKDDKPSYWHEFYVKGSGDFPVDMLRFDRCFPATETDSYKIENGAYSEPKRMRVIKLESYATFVTPDRWMSFTWRIISHKEAEAFEQKEVGNV